MDEKRIDLTMLDPERDPAKWEAFVTTTMRRVEAAVAARGVSHSGALETIAGWRRPVLLAAAATVAILVPVEFALEAREARAEAARRMAHVSLAWVESQTPPSGADILRAISEAEPE